MTIVKNRAIHGFLAFLTLFLVSVALAQPARAPVPAAQQQQASTKLLDEGFGVSKAVGTIKKQQLVKTLVQAVSDPNLPKGDLYVVLTTVISLAQDLRDLRVMTDTVEQLVKEFAVAPTR